MINHSQKLEELIDGEVQEIVESSYKEARQVLADHYDKLKDMAQQLLKREKIDESDIVAILGPRPQQKEVSEAETGWEKKSAAEKNAAPISTRRAVN
ncbi:MAG: hypothetical protein P8Y74_11130 [Desulfobacterales bacterium]